MVMIIKNIWQKIMELVDEKQVHVEYLNKVYALDKDKLKYIFNKFGVEIDVDDIDDVNRVLEKYCLFDVVFLENLNKIW